MDKFEEKLEQSTQELKECQEKKDTNSCLQCQNILGCEVREEYVQAVYDSMSKGQGGGFEF